MRPVLVADHRSTDRPPAAPARTSCCPTCWRSCRRWRTCCSIVARCPRRPVLVVTDADHEVVAGDDAGVAIEIARHRVVELDALRLGPLDESALVREPAGRAHEARVAVGEPVLLVDHPVDIGLFAAVHGPCLAVVAFGRRPHQHSSAERSGKRHPPSAGVQALAAPTVVGVVGVGGQHQQGSGAGRRGANDERGVPDALDLQARRAQ